MGKLPLHLLSVTQSVHPDGFRGKRVTRMGLLEWSWDCDNYFFPEVTKMGSIIWPQKRL